MGIFGKKKENESRHGISGVDYKKIGDFDIPEEERIDIAREALRKIGDELSGPSIAGESDVLELRGKLGALPVQVALPQIGWVTIEMIVDGHWPLFSLEYNRDRTPARDRLLDPLWDDMDERGVFLAPGVFFKGPEADRIAAAFLKLPADFVQRAVNTMISEEIRYLNLRPKSFFLQFHKTPSKMDDLIGSIKTGLFLLRDSALILGTAVPARRLHEPPQAAPLRCRYCRGWFFPVDRNLHCLNCGAPYDSDESPA